MDGMTSIIGMDRSSIVFLIIPILHSVTMRYRLHCLSTFLIGEGPLFEKKIEIIVGVRCFLLVSVAVVVVVVVAATVVV